MSFLKLLSRNLIVFHVVLTAASIPANFSSALAAQLALPHGISIIDSLESGVSDDDLLPVAKVVGTSTIVGLGEGAHGSGGFHKAQIRVAKYLITHMGFRAIAFESPWRITDIASRYVDTCEGSAEEATRSITLAWNGQPALNFLRWLCAYNQDHSSDKVKLFGIDVKQPWEDGPALCSFMRTVAPSDAERYIRPISQCTGVGYQSEEDFARSDEWRGIVTDARPIPRAKYDACQDGLTDLEQYIQVNHAALAAAASEEAVATILVSIRTMRHAENWLFNYNNFDSPNHRDLGMADIFDQLRDLRASGSRAIVWSHDLHIVKKFEDAVLVKDDGSVRAPRDKTLGGYLKDAFGPQYRSIATIGYRVSGRTRETIAKVGTIQDLLHGLGKEYLFVRMPNSLFDASSTQKVYESDGGGWYYEMIPQSQYDAFLFLENSPRVEPIGSP